MSVADVDSVKQFSECECECVSEPVLPIQRQADDNCVADSWLDISVIDFAVFGVVGGVYIDWWCVEE